SLDSARGGGRAHPSRRATSVRARACSGRYRRTPSRRRELGVSGTALAGARTHVAPSRSPRPGLRASLLLLVPIILASPSGYYLRRGYWSPPSHSARGPQMASLAVKGDAPPSSIGRQELPRTPAQEGDHMISVQHEISSQSPEIFRDPRGGDALQ